MHRATVSSVGGRSTRRVPFDAMKYVVLVPDGCADEPLAELGGRTPLEAAAHAEPRRARAHAARSGRANVIPGGLPPGSDVGNLSILGYDPPSSTPAARRSRPRRWASSSRPTRSRTAATSSPSAPTARWSTSPPATSRASRATRSSPRSTPRSATAATACASIPASSTATSCVVPERLGRRRVRAAARPHRQARGLPDRSRGAEAQRADGRVAAGRRRGRGRRSTRSRRRSGCGARACARSCPTFAQPLRRRRPADVGGRSRARARRARRHRGGRRARRDRRLRQRLRRAARRVPRRRSPTATSSSCTSRRPTKPATRGRVDEKVDALERWDAEIIGPLLDALPAFGAFRILLLPDHATPVRLRHPHLRAGAVPALRLRGRRSTGGAYTEPATAGMPAVEAHELMGRLIA